MNPSHFKSPPPTKPKPISIETPSRGGRRPRKRMRLVQRQMGQITPVVLTQEIADPDPAVAKRVFEAMITMKKIDIAKIEAARRG